MTTNILDQIVAEKRREIQRHQSESSLSEMHRRLRDAPPARDFLARLANATGMGIIAEVKKASPSAGVLKADFDPVSIACAYADAGADCISVLTDEPFFQGKLAYLTAIRSAVSIPLLRKDFILDPYQIFQARVHGADAVLLIAEILTDSELHDLLAATHAIGMHALVELYEPENLPRVVASGAKLIGINNRNLRTFVTRLEHTCDLAGTIPKDRLVVSESGIRTREDVCRVRSAGSRAILVGETLMRSGDIAGTLKMLRGDS